MKKNHLVAVLCLFMTFIVSTSAKASFFNYKTYESNSFLFTENLVGASLNTDAVYKTLQLEEYGLEKTALDYAVKGYELLLNEGKVENSQYLTIVDFSQPSNKRRFYLLDINNKELVANTYVMHGKNSGGVYAEKFSNVVDSYQSSLGFYVTKYTYIGSRGYSLRISGMEEGFNTNAEKRGVVIHGSKYINESRARNGNVERSLGCPALPTSDYKNVIKKIKNGSVMFIYHPNEEYLQNSPILNEINSPSELI